MNLRPPPTRKKMSTPGQIAAGSDLTRRNIAPNTFAGPRAGPVEPDADDTPGGPKRGGAPFRGAAAPFGRGAPPRKKKAYPGLKLGMPPGGLGR
jgi:hypothetical protein